MHSRARAWGIVVLLTLLVLQLASHGRTSASATAAGPCPVAATAAASLNLYYPLDDCAAAGGPPYPAVAFAHGFSFFGLSDGAADNAGNGRFLASWGFVTAVPTLPDDAVARTADLLAALDALESANLDPQSPLFGQIDPARLGVAGHSLGGATALAAAAHDPRIQAVVALDPVYHARSLGWGETPVWDPAVAGPQIVVPAVILGAPADDCNSQADHVDIYPHLGAAHRASYQLPTASHCVFADPGNSACSLVCGGSVDPALTDLSQKYMLAWFNYYVALAPAAYDTLYGAGAAADVAAGRIQRQVDTYPRAFSAAGLPGAVTLEWALYDQPVIAGYQIFRRLPGEPYPAMPYAEVGRVGSFHDTQIAIGRPYEYRVQSVDVAGQPHQPSADATAVPLPVGARWWLPALVTP